MKIYNLLIAMILSFGLLGVFSNTVITTASAEQTTEQTKEKSSEKKQDSTKQEGNR